MNLRRIPKLEKHRRNILCIQMSPMVLVYFTAFLHHEKNLKRRIISLNSFGAFTVSHKSNEEKNRYSLSFIPD
jgi:hypothetical protein